MEDRTKSMVWGILFILVGVLFLLRNLGVLSFSLANTWPFLLLFPGVVFWLFWFADRTHYRLLMPGTILIVYGLYFLLENQWPYRLSGALWPIFILGPGLGFWAMYVLGSREERYLRSGLVLTVISGVFFALALDNRFVWPLLLIGVGVYLIVKEKVRQRGSPRESESTPASSESTGDD